MFQANFTVSPLTGVVFATDFTVTNLTSGGSVEKYVWDFGTGELIYDIVNPTYKYKSPGTYTITLTATNFDGESVTISREVTTEIAYRDYLKFTQIPESFPNPGVIPEVPFKIEVLTSNVNHPIIVDLFASNSKSTPLQYASDRWNFLTPTWKFLDKNFTPVTSLSVQTVPIIINNNVVAVSGESEFFYVDSSSTGTPTINCPILITATLQTSSFNNSLDSNIYPYESHANNKTVRAGVIWQVNDLTPTLLKISSNYVEEVYPKQWSGIKVPILITAHSDRSQIIPGAKSGISEVLFSYPLNNTLGKNAPVTLTIPNYNNDAFTVDEAPLYFQTTDRQDLNSGGYIFTTITSLTSLSSATLVAHTTGYLDNTTTTGQFPYPKGYVPNTSVWVSNPEKNTLNKITLVPDPGNCTTINYFRENGILVDGIIKEVTVPALTTSNTFNYTVSGISGIYGVAIDPRNYDLIAADVELECLYKFSNTGDLLKTFYLSSLGDFDPRKKLLEFWTWKTPAPETSATRFAFYNPVPLSPFPKNYLVTVGGVIQPTDMLEVYPYEGIIRLNVFTDLLTPENQEAYPPGDIEFNVIQIFNPSLPSKYASSLSYWVTASPEPTSVFSLTGTNVSPLSSNPGNYIVSVNGILQRPNSYSIDNTANTINFVEPVLPNKKVHVVYMPGITEPATWTYTFNQATTSIPLTGNSNYQLDDKSGFIVNIGGVLQRPEIFNHNLQTISLDFSVPLPTDVPISVTQISVPETINNTAAYTPAYVSLDKNYNIWVSLFNSVSVLKFDPDFNFLFSVVPSGIKWPTRSWVNTPTGIDYQSTRFEEITRMVSNSSQDTIDYYTDEFYLKPPVVETDRENNCWVTYANPLCSLLVKYGEHGNILAQIPLDRYTSPINVAVNIDNNIWVSNFHGSVYTYTSLSGSLQLYDTNTQQLIKTVRNISRPGYLALDKNNNVWFTHGLRRLGYYNTHTDTLCSWTLELSGGFTTFILPSSFEANLETFDELDNQEDEELGGLAVDVYDRVWILDSVQNFAYVISATPDFLSVPYRFFKIKPEVTSTQHLNIQTGETYTDFGDYYYRSAQATGDWTGNRWYQKYALIEAISAIPLSGISSKFDVSPFTNNHQIRRVNESFNTAEYFKSLALPETLNSNTTLFDKFFPATVGTGQLSANEDPGQIVYERIANFIINHSDVDTCNIDQLLSLAEQAAVAASDYAAVYPTDIKNMLDIASVPRSKLWGIKDEVPVINRSIGEEYNTQTDLLTAGTKIILKNKSDSSLSLLSVPPLPTGETVYPIDNFDGYGLLKPITINYIFYKFVPAYTGNYVENIIDWNSPLTTQMNTMSTLNDWYGDGGSIETAFRYLLTKNLFLK
jgi:PKD repeat protein